MAYTRNTPLTRDSWTRIIYAHALNTCLTKPNLTPTVRDKFSIRPYVQARRTNRNTDVCRIRPLKHLAAALRYLNGFDGKNWR